jgi:hypothetical protein
VASERDDLIGSAGSCEFCGCEFRVPSDVMRHHCAAMQMVEHERAPGYVFPTWREALTSAYNGVDEAYERRKRMTQAAYDAGLSFRAIADAVGKTPATIHKIIGRQRGKDSDSILDSPAGVKPDA